MSKDKDEEYRIDTGAISFSVIDRLRREGYDVSQHGPIEFKLSFQVKTPDGVATFIIDCPNDTRRMSNHKVFEKLLEMVRNKLDRMNEFDGSGI